METSRLIALFLSALIAAPLADAAPTDKLTLDSHSSWQTGQTRTVERGSWIGRKITSPDFMIDLTYPQFIGTKSRVSAAINKKIKDQVDALVEEASDGKGLLHISWKLIDYPGEFISIRLYVWNHVLITPHPRREVLSLNLSWHDGSELTLSKVFVDKKATLNSLSRQCRAAIKLEGSPPRFFS